eukprot:2065266-Alexandrium_andersonii.AAC.1
MEILDATILASPRASPTPRLSAEVHASWREELSDHACLSVLAAGTSRRCGLCRPHQLRNLPRDAWADLR